MCLFVFGGEVNKREITNTLPNTRAGSQHVATIQDALEKMTGSQYNSTWFDAASTTRQAGYYTTTTYYLSDFTSFLPRDVMIITDEFTQILEYGLGLHSVTTIVTAEHESLNTIISSVRPRLYARHNNLGGVSYFINEAGTLQSYNEYDPWGNPYTARATDQNFINLNMGITGFTGFAYDRVLGMYFAHFRMYDHQAKRFTAVDPIRGNMFNPQTINPYLYVLNSPTNFIDPWGLSPLLLSSTSENDGAEATWNRETRTATVSSNGLTMDFTHEQNGSYITPAPTIILNPDVFNSSDSSAGAGFATFTFVGPPNGASNSRDIASTFPPDFWAAVRDEIDEHNPGMSSFLREHAIREMIRFISNNYAIFSDWARANTVQSAPAPMAQLTVAMFGRMEINPARTPTGQYANYIAWVRDSHYANLVRDAQNSLGNATSAVGVTSAINQIIAMDRYRKNIRDIMAAGGDVQGYLSNEFRNLQFSGTIHSPLFNTMDELARHWARTYYGVTQFSLFEVSSLIFLARDANGNILGYAYTPMYIGNPHNTGINWIDANASAITANSVFVGTLHTHPNGVNFSEGDTRNAKNRNLASYVAVPTIPGNSPTMTTTSVRSYTLVGSEWQNQAVAGGTNMTFQPLTPQQQGALINELEPRWAEHIQTCTGVRDCANRAWPNRPTPAAVSPEFDHLR